MKVRIEWSNAAIISRDGQKDQLSLLIDTESFGGNYNFPAPEVIFFSIPKQISAQEQ